MHFSILANYSCNKRKKISTDKFHISVVGVHQTQNRAD